MVTFFETEDHLEASQIKDVENYAKLTFPEEYKNHLLKYNGGRCLPNIFSFHQNGKRTNSSVDWFLAIYNGEYDNLKNYIDIFKIEEKRLPYHILPIAHDPGGNLICISCEGEDFGYIYIWDHEEEIDYSTSTYNSNYLNLYFVANSITEFLNELK